MSRDYRALFDRIGPVPLVFDRDKQVFVSGHEQFTLRDFSASKLYSADSVADVDTTPLSWGGFGPLVLPRMHDWMQDNLTDHVLDDTVDVMIEAYKTIRPAELADLPISLQRDRGGFIGFDAMRPRGDYPEISLRTLGNCACLGVSLQGMFGGVQARESKIASYEFHNVDTEEQRNSLLAGLGHVAFLASKA